MGVPPTTAKRAVYLADNLTPSSLKAVEEAGLENSLGALLAAAQVPDGYKEQSLQNYVEQQERKKQKKDELAKVQALAASTEPRSPRAAFDAWFWSLDPAMRSQVRTWILSDELEAYFQELDEAAVLVAEDRAGLH